MIGHPVAPAASVPTGRAARRRWFARAGRVVVLMGVVSMVTDLSSEMVAAILPLYVIGVLGLSPLQYGFVDGFYQGVTALVRVVGGLTADLTRRPKWISAIGYAVSAACKLALLPVQGFAALSAVIAADRLGKGLRTAPRDAIIAAAARPRAFGYAFGLHRALDTIGAMCGPLVAFAVIAALPTGGYHALFLLSFSLAAIGVAVLVLVVPDVRPGAAARRATGPDRATATATGPDRAASAADPNHTASAADPNHTAGGVGHGCGTGDGHTHRAGGLPCVGCKGTGGGHLPRGPVGLRAAVRTSARLLTRPGMVRLVAAATLLSLVTVGDGFVYLALRDRAGISATYFPLLYVGTNLVFLALAIPLGRLADRRGRQWIFLGGHLAAAAGYLLLLAPLPGPVLVAAVLGLVGAYYAATDGVLSALGSQLLETPVRATGLSVVQTAVAVGRLVAAVGFGAVWAAYGPRRSALLYGIAMLVAVTAAAALIGRQPRAGTGAVAEVPERGRNGRQVTV